MSSLLLTLVGGLLAFPPAPSTVRLALVRLALVVIFGCGFVAVQGPMQANPARHRLVDVAWLDQAIQCLALMARLILRSSRGRPTSSL